MNVYSADVFLRITEAPVCSVDQVIPSLASSLSAICITLPLPFQLNHAHVHSLKTDLFSSLFTKNMNTFNEWRSFITLVHITDGQSDILHRKLVS